MRMPGTDELQAPPRASTGCADTLPDSGVRASPHAKPTWYQVTKGVGNVLWQLVEQRYSHTRDVARAALARSPLVAAAGAIVASIGVGVALPSKRTSGDD